MFQATDDADDTKEGTGDRRRMYTGRQDRVARKYGWREIGVVLSVKTVTFDGRGLGFQGITCEA